MRTNKKGQAAMEFLMTYGWAILAAVIVIGVLASFGVFSPSSFVPNSCVLSAPLGCNAGTVATVTGTPDVTTVNLELRNGAGGAVTLESIEVANCATLTLGTGPGDMADQDLTVYSIVCTDPRAAGKFQEDITVSYKKSGSTLALQSSGKLVDDN